MFKTAVTHKRIVLVIVALVLAAIVTGALMANGYDEIQATIIVLTVIGIIAFFLIPRLAREDEKGFLPKILFWGLIARIISVFLRIWIDFGMGVSVSDAIGYMRNGTAVAQHIWHLEFSQLSSFLTWGTSFINLFTGIIYSFIGITQNGGYLVFSLFSFFGSYFFYRAFTLAFPNENKRLFALLIFFLPSIWANGIGKDSLIFLFIGLCTYGAAKYILHQKFTGLLITVLSILGVFYIRPHIAFILAVSLFAGYLLQGIRHRQFHRLSFYVVVISAGAALIVILPRIASLIGVPGLSITEVLTYLNGRQELTAIGGSTFAPIDISNPINIPYLFITILFRPFPWEAHNVQAIIQSFEGLLLLGILLWRFRSIKKAAVLSISNGYTLFIFIYIAAFIVAFSTIQNFGILARQRTMLYPFLFMLLAYTPASSQADIETADMSRVPVVHGSS
jgi:hypothetical protein